MENTDPVEVPIHDDEIATRGLLKELADLKFALDEAAIVATTDQGGRIP